jgi:hypothetical protein
MFIIFFLLAAIKKGTETTYVLKAAATTFNENA